MVRDEEVGLAIGMAETNKAIAMIGAPFLAGMLYQISPEKPFSVGFGIICVGLLLSIAFFSFQNKPIQLVERFNLTK